MTVQSAAEGGSRRELLIALRARIAGVKAVVAYLAKNFPDFKPHHKSSRDGLVAKAIELAAK